MEERLGEKIYRARRAKGLSQEDLAEAVGVSRQTVSQWENDKFQPNSDNIDLLCRVLDLSREDFVGRSEGGDRRTAGRKGLAVLIGIFTAAAIMAMVTAILGPICLTSNTGDMMDNSYSIPPYAFYVALAVTVILMAIDVGMIILKIREKNKRS